MRPFFPIYGSKWNIARHYPKPLPGLVSEPFAGGAGYATFYDCPQVSLYDADPIIAGVWAYLLRVAPHEIMALPEMPEVGDCVDNYDLPQEAKWLIGFWLNRGSAQPKKSRTAYSARTDRAQLNWSLRAKERIAAQIPLIGGWTVRNASYDSAPNVKATWFIDPPYGDKGKFYRVGFSDFEALGPWCETRQGRLIVCERDDATWLPFDALGSFKSSLGRASEGIFTRDSVCGNNRISMLKRNRENHDRSDCLPRRRKKVRSSALRSKMSQSYIGNSSIRVPVQSLIDGWLPTRAPMPPTPADAYAADARQAFWIRTSDKLIELLEAAT